VSTHAEAQGRRDDDAFWADAERNQRIADRREELILEALEGKGDFWPGVLRVDGEPNPPEWDLEQGNRLLVVMRDCFAAPGGKLEPATVLRLAQSIAKEIEDYATRRATEEIE